MAANENDSLSQSIPNLGSIASSLSDEDEDSGLDELLSLILPEVDEEIENNPTARQELYESPILNAEEYPLIDNDNDDDSLPMLPPLNDNDIKSYSEQEEEQKSASPINNNLLPQLIANISSFPIMRQKTEQDPDPNDEDISGLMDLNLFGQGPITNKPATTQRIHRTQSAPQPMQKHNNTNPMNIERKTDPIKEIKELLLEMDEDENGYIDFSEFEEAIKIIDNTIIHGEIDAIYELMTGSNIPSFPGMDNILQKEANIDTLSPMHGSKRKTNRTSSHKHKLVHVESSIGWKHKELDHLENAMRKSLDALKETPDDINRLQPNLETLRSKSMNDSLSITASISTSPSNQDNNNEECKDLGELNIKIFIGYIGYKYDEFKRQKAKRRTGKSPHSLLQTVLSDSILIVMPSEDVADPKMIIRIAFPDIFQNNNDNTPQNSMEVTTTNLWGVKKLSSLDRLTKELKEEAPDCKTLDYAEFEAAMNNLGVQYERNNLEILFSHFIEAQSVSITSKHLHKRKELNILFFTKYIGKEVRNHEVMDPKQILEAAFGQLLLKGIKRQKGSHKDILNVNNNLAVMDGNNNNKLNGFDVNLTPEGSPNPYFDDDLMNDVSKQFGPDEIRKYEQKHSVSPLNNGHNKNRKKMKETDHNKLVRMQSRQKWKPDELDDLESAMQAQFTLLMDQHTTATTTQSPQQQNINDGGMGIVHEDQAIE